MTSDVAEFPAGRKPSGRRWGTAGVALTAREAQERDQAKGRERLRNRQRLNAAYRDWRAGNVQPWRISQALDAAGLWGPEVDEKCGGREPMVDEWEAGTLYPTWEQLLKLATLTEVTPGMFMVRPGQDPIPAKATSMRFHADVEDEAEPVLAFTPNAIAAEVCYAPTTRPAVAANDRSTP